MVVVRVTERIAAPPAEVFRRISDFANAPQTVRGIKRVEMLTDGPVGVGTRFRETRVMFGREASETMEVVAFDAPRSYTLRASAQGFVYASTMTVTPAGAGAEVEMTFEARPQTFFAKVMGIVFAPLLKSCRKAIVQDLHDVKTAMEARAAG